MPLPIPPSLRHCLTRIHEKGGKPLVVGGAVRDWLLGEEPKDFDVEVYNLTGEDLEARLGEVGKVDLVGKSFGIFKLTLDGETFDFSLPRTDSKSGEGHRGFEVQTDRFLSPEEASKRRDFTVNSMFYDPLKEDIYDPHGGVEDLKNRILRHTSEAFTEDPLRALRAVQFSARFGMAVFSSTAELCQDMFEAGCAKELPSERVLEEVRKFLVKGKHFVAGMNAWKRTGWISLHPELAALDGLPQDPKWHPEGDALTHTAFCLEALHQIPRFQALPDDEKFVYSLGVLCHDLGKASTTEQVWDEKEGRIAITSHNHQVEGVPLAKAFAGGLGLGRDIVERVGLLTRYHMEHLWVSSPKDVRRLAVRLSPSSPMSPTPKILETIQGLSLVTEADHGGRPPLEKQQPPKMKAILKIAEKENCLVGPPLALVRGTDLLEIGVPQGKTIGKCLNAVYEKQLDGAFRTRDEAIGWIGANTRNFVVSNGGPAPLVLAEHLKKLSVPPGKIYGKILEEGYRLQLAGSILTGEAAEEWVSRRMSGLEHARPLTETKACSALARPSGLDNHSQTRSKDWAK